MLLEKKCVFCIRNISKRKQISGKTHAEHCWTHPNKAACEIWSVFDKVHFWVKNLMPFFHRTLQLLFTFLFFWKTSLVISCTMNNMVLKRLLKKKKLNHLHYDITNKTILMLLRTILPCVHYDTIQLFAFQRWIFGKIDEKHRPSRAS